MQSSVSSFIAINQTKPVTPLVAEACRLPPASHPVLTPTSALVDSRAKRKRGNHKDAFRNFPVVKPGGLGNEICNGQGQCVSLLNPSGASGNDLPFNPSTECQNSANEFSGFTYDIARSNAYHSPSSHAIHAIPCASSPGWDPASDNRIPIDCAGSSINSLSCRTPTSGGSGHNVFDATVAQGSNILVQTMLESYYAGMGYSQACMVIDNADRPDNMPETCFRTWEKDVEAEMFDLDDELLDLVECADGIKSDMTYGRMVSHENSDRGNDIAGGIFGDSILKPCHVLSPEVNTIQYPMTCDSFELETAGEVVRQDLTSKVTVEESWNLIESEEIDVNELEKHLAPPSINTRETTKDFQEPNHNNLTQTLPDLPSDSSLGATNTIPTQNSTSVTDYEYDLVPIVRPPFPKRTPDRSPIHGLTTDTMLRVCFRVGEALNTGCDAVRRGRNIVIELYARVLTTERDMTTGVQSFVLGDLFHKRPPFLNGVYEGWKGGNPWDYDSAVFLEPNAGTERLCRCVGRMKREKHGWQLSILNIWEAAWEDVVYVKGIVCS